MSAHKALELCAQHSLLLKEQKIISRADQMWTCSQLSSTADIWCIMYICSQRSKSEQRILPAHFTVWGKQHKKWPELWMVLGFFTTTHLNTWCSQSTTPHKKTQLQCICTVT